jgi:hypothetical protein
MASFLVLVLVLVLVWEVLGGGRIHALPSRRVFLGGVSDLGDCTRLVYSSLARPGLDRRDRGREMNVKQGAVRNKGKSQRPLFSPSQSRRGRSIVFLFA